MGDKQLCIKPARRILRPALRGESRVIVNDCSHDRIFCIFTRDVDFNQGPWTGGLVERYQGECSGKPEQVATVAV